MAEGYDCVKYDFTTFTPDGKSYTDGKAASCHEDLAVLKSASPQCGGHRPGRRHNRENHSSTDANAAIQIARMAEKYNIFISKNNADSENDKIYT